MGKIVVGAISVDVIGDRFATIVVFTANKEVLAIEFGLRIGPLILQDLADAPLALGKDARPRRTYFDLSRLSISYFLLYFLPFTQFLLSCSEQWCSKDP